MSEKKKGIIILSVIGAFLLLLIIVGVVQKEMNNKPHYSTNYEEAFSGGKRKVLYIGSSSCSVCSMFTPYMEYLSKTYNFTYYYIDAAEMDYTELQSVLERLGQDISNFGTPYVAFLDNGKKIGELSGYVTESSLFDYLKANQILDSSEVYVPSEKKPTDSGNNSSGTTKDDDSSYTSLSFIDYDKYEEIYNSGEKAIIVLGQTGCGACTAYKPVINEIAGEYNIPIYYVNMTTLASEDAYSLMGSLSYFDEVESWGTPLTLIIENKDVVAYQEGSNSKANTLSFLQENGFAN